jgi:hypothetical protein
MQNDPNRKPGYESLAIAIVEKAANDYRGALRYLKAHRYARAKGEEERVAQAQQRAAECERFFQSQWCYTLTTVAGDYIITKIKDEVQGEAI